MLGTRLSERIPRRFHTCPLARSLPRDNVRSRTRAKSPKSLGTGEAEPAGAEFPAGNGTHMIGADNLALELTPASEPLNFFPVHT